MILTKEEMEQVIACAMDQDLMLETMKFNSKIAWASMDSALVEHCHSALANEEMGWVDATD